MFYHYLPLAKVFSGNRELMIKGYHHSRTVAEEETDNMIQVAVNNNSRYSQHILQRFRRHFLTITDTQPPLASRTPEALTRIFGQDTTRLNKKYTGCASVSGSAAPYPAGRSVLQHQLLRLSTKK